MDEGLSEQLIKRAVAASAGDCGHCHRHYDEGSVSVIGHQDDLWFLSLTCARCRSRALVAALVKESPLVSDTDLVAGELDRFRDRAPVGSDDVRDLHQFLSQFDGDFKTLFGQ